jgi:hypothetical protein
MAQLVPNLFEGEALRQQMACTRVSQAVRPTSGLMYAHRDEARPDEGTQTPG